MWLKRRLGLTQVVFFYFPGGFPALCAEYRGGGKPASQSTKSQATTKKKAIKAKDVLDPQAEPAEEKVIGNADEFFVNPLGN